MEVILLESLNKLGKIGDIVNVKDGFARNFLIPQKKALRANQENKDYFTKIKDQVLEKNKQTIEDAKSVIKKISEKEIIFIRNASDNGQLYGSVSPKDISNYFDEQKIEVKPSNINLHNVIKKIGIYDINIKLHADVSCNLKINVATSLENAKSQKIEVEKAEKQDDKKPITKKTASKLSDNSEKNSSNLETDPKVENQEKKLSKINESPEKKTDTKKSNIQENSKSLDK